MPLDVCSGTTAFLAGPPNFVTSPAPRAPRLVVLSGLNTHVKRAVGSAQDCGDDKCCGVCFTVGTSLLVGLVGPQLSIEPPSFQVASPWSLTSRPSGSDSFGTCSCRFCL